jgi:hypothetical protein
MPDQEELLHPVLPRLKEGRDRKTENFPKKGAWHGRPAAELDKLSASLKTERLEFEVNAIPDMWARPILFEMALLDADHPIHQRILGEWRGILALLALRKVRRFGDLTVRDLHFKDEAKESEDLDFLAALSKVVPQKKFAEDSTWKNTYIILFGGKPIAVTSPITLVCTSTHYFNAFSEVSWYDGRFLLDPKESLNDTEKPLLAGWLKQLKASLVKHPGIDKKMDEFEHILKLFEKFIEDLGGAKEDVVLSTETLGIKEGIYQYLDRPIHVSDGVRSQSHVQIIPSKRPAPKESLLVIDKEIAKQWKIPEKDIFVYRSIPLDRISPGRLVGDRGTLLDIKLENARWCKPEDFFTEKLVLIKQKNALPGTLYADGCSELFFQDVSVTPIVPLTNLILPYLTAEDISNRLRFEQLEDEFKVTIHLPLAGSYEQPRDFEISKTFRAKENEVETVTTVPILETWPNFISSEWKAYYTYFSTTGEKTFYAAPLNTVDTQKSFPENKDQIEREINYLDHFPEVFECKLYRIDPRNKKPVPYHVGVLLAKKPASLPSLGKSFKMGIDFGSSSTNVFLKEVYIDPVRVTLDEHFFSMTAVSSSRRVDLYDYFLPGTTEEIPFLSIFHDFLIPQNEMKALLDGHIYFPDDPQKFDAVKDGMMTDLKWGDPDERRRARLFLEQLCLQCAAEAVARGAKEISWRFSFPTAFSRDEKDAFISHWKMIIDDNCTLTGIGSNENKLPYHSESIAAARYFANNKEISAALPRGAVFIDIGGRTSDISLWGRHNHLMMQSSLQLAGRDVFGYPLLEKTGLLEGFISSEELAVLNREKLKRNPLAFCAQLDAIVSAESGRIMKKLPHYGGETNMREFKQLIGIGISGIIFYIGLLIKSFRNVTDYIEAAPNIYFGGNGSRLLHWLSSGDFNSDSAYNYLLKSIFRESYGVSKEKNFEIKISPEPKAEVACGLVMDETTLSYEDDREGYFLSGEAFITEDNEEYGWETRITTDIIKSGIKLSSNLEQFKVFLKAFDGNARSLGIMQIEADAAILEKTRDQVNKEISNMKYQNESEMRIEPLFILVLKKFLELKVKEWARK